MTTSYYQGLFDGSNSFTHLSMVRMYIYLLVNDYRKNFDKFKWLEFLRIEDEKTLIRKHFFTAKAAGEYLRAIGLFRQFTRINAALYFFGISGVMIRICYLAYAVVPFHWFILSTVPNVVAYFFMTQNAFTLYNYYVLIFFANAMFIRKSMQSLVAQRSALWRYKLKKSKLRQLAKQNLIQFNYIMKNFKASQRNFNYLFCYR